MTTQQILTQYLIEELLDTSTSNDLDADDNLLTSGLIDSLAIMRLINFIEEQFKVEVYPEDVTIENFRTINVIADYLHQRQG